MMMIPDPCISGQHDWSGAECRRCGDCLPSLGEAWEGVDIWYTEQDFPTSQPYQRRIPGWKCRVCGQQYGTSGLPPNPCKCGAAWRPE